MFSRCISIFTSIKSLKLTVNTYSRFFNSFGQAVCYPRFDKSLEILLAVCNSVQCLLALFSMFLISASFIFFLALLQDADVGDDRKGGNSQSAVAGSYGLVSRAHSDCVCSAGSPWHWIKLYGLMNPLKESLWNYVPNIDFRDRYFSLVFFPVTRLGPDLTSLLNYHSNNYPTFWVLPVSQSSVLPRMRIPLPSPPRLVDNLLRFVWHPFSTRGRNSRSTQRNVDQI